MPDNNISSQKAKQGRGGRHVFLILVIGIGLALVAFVAVMFYRPGGF